MTSMQRKKSIQIDTKMSKMLELAEKNFKEANSNYRNEAFQNMLIMAKKK